MRCFRRSGFSLMEVLLAVAIFVTAVITFAVLAIDASVTQRLSVERQKATFLAQEGIEAARSLRDVAFSSVTTGTHGVVLASSAWQFSGTSDTTDGFTRVVTVAAPSSDYRVVTSTVTWAFTPTRTESVTLTSVLTNWRKDPGTWAAPQVAATVSLSGSIAALASSLQGNYLYVTTPESPAGSEFYIYDVSDPGAPLMKGQLEINATAYMLDSGGGKAYVGSASNLDEVKVIDVSDALHPREAGSVILTGSADVYSVAASGTTVHTVRDVQGNQATYWIHDISNPSSPALLGSLDLGSGANDIALRQGSPPYAFVAAKDDSQELKTVNVTNPSNVAVGGGYNLAGIEDARAVAVTGTTAVLGTDGRAAAGELFVFGVSDPTHPSLLSSYEIGATVNRIRIYGNFAYLATASSTKEFMVFDISNPANPTLVGGKDLSGTATGLSISADGQVVYVTTDNPASGLVIIQTGS